MYEKLVRTKTMKRLLALVAIGALFADGQIDDLQREVDSLKHRVDQLSAGRQMTAPSEQADAVGLGFSVDALYWAPQASKLVYAVSQTQSYAALPNNYSIGQEKIDWAWGFRVGASYQFNYDNWKLGADYTYLRPDGASRIGFDNAAEGRVTNSQASASLDSNNNTAGKIGEGTYEYRYDYATLQLSRSFCLTPEINMTTHTGLGTGWFYQNLISKISGGNGDEFLGTNQISINAVSDMWGIGPVFGLTANWELGLGFSILGDITAEAMLTQYNLSLVERVNDNAATQVRTVTNFWVVRPQLFTTLGMAYDYFCNNGSQHFGLRAGWESQIWFRGDTTVSSTGTVEGDLTFNGVTLRALFEF